MEPPPASPPPSSSPSHSRNPSSSSSSHVQHQPIPHPAASMSSSGTSPPTMRGRSHRTPPRDPVTAGARLHRSSTSSNSPSGSSPSSSSSSTSSTPSPQPPPALPLPRVNPPVERRYPLARRRPRPGDIYGGSEVAEADLVQQPMPYGRVRNAPSDQRHDYREILEAQMASDSEAADKDGRFFGFLPASKDSYPLYAVLLVGLITIPRVQDRDELVRVMIATAAYGVAVACSLFILQLTARSGFWTPDLETVPRVHRRGRPWFWGGRRPGRVTREVEDQDREELEHPGRRGRSSLPSTTGDVVEEVYSSEEDEEVVAATEEERSRRISEALAQAREKNRQVQMMEELKKALTEAQLQATTLQLKLNYYDSELMREKRERREEKETLLSRQKFNVARLFSLMIKYSPVTLREALEPSEEARCIITPRLPFEVVHVNQAWSNTFQWDSHEIVGYNLNFFKGPIVDGTSWEQLLDMLLVYGYATADIINSGSGGGHFVHVMTITPVVAPIPVGGAGPAPPTAAFLQQGQQGNPQGLDVDVRLLAYMVRSVVKKLPDLSPDLRERLDQYVTSESVSVNPTYLLGPAKARYPLQHCHRRSLMENLDYMNQTDDPLYLVDSKGHILHTNALWTDLTLYSFREAEGRTLEEVLCGDAAFHERMRSILSSQQAGGAKAGEEWSFKTALTKRGGERFLGQVQLVSLGGPDRLLLGKIEVLPSSGGGSSSKGGEGSPMAASPPPPEEPA